MIAEAHGGGASFGGAAAYCLGMDRATLDAERGSPEHVEVRPVEPSARVAWTDVRNLATTDVPRAARQMAATVQYAGELKRLAGGSRAGRPLAKPVYHYTLSWARDERPDRAEMGRAVDGSLEALGMEDRQAFVVAHNDTRHPHAHVVVNRVSAEDGRAAGRGNDRLRLSRWAERWEREHGGLRCERRAEHNRRRAAGEWVVDRTAAANARHRRSDGEIERVKAGRWRPGRNVADVVLRRLHERRAWDEARAELEAERKRADRRQLGEWRELYRRQDREKPEGPGPELEERHLRERAALGREHGGEARDLERDAARTYRTAVESPVRARDLDPRAIADELARVEGELPAAERAAFRQQVRLPAPGVTVEIERSRDRDLGPGR